MDDQLQRLGYRGSYRMSTTPPAILLFANSSKTHQTRLNRDNQSKLFYSQLAVDHSFASSGPISVLGANNG